MPRRGQGQRAYAQRTDLGETAAVMPESVQPHPQQPEPDIPQGEARPQGQAARRRPAPQPGAHGPAMRPSERPDEPVTAGLDVGAGPGSEALGAFGPQSLSEDAMRLAEYLPALEAMATLPNASKKTRSMLRSLKAFLPPEALIDGPDMRGEVSGGER